MVRGLKKKKMLKNRIIKSWELDATSQKSFYKKAYVLEVKSDPISYYDHVKTNMGNQCNGIHVMCRL